MTEIKKPTLKKNEPITISPELMGKYQQLVNFLKNDIAMMKTNLEKMNAMLDKLVNFNPLNPNSLEIDQEIQDTLNVVPLNSYSEDDCEVIEGLFDGYFMIGGNQKKYPVPMNYSSKTKLVPGDMLKLKVTPEGKFIYKLIKPVERKHLRALLSKTDENKFTANTEDGKVYFLNQAAVTFFKGTPGDELYILINEKDPAAFAAIEAIIKK
ncbi:MAG: hypothetical protein K6E76_02065 [Patescibacteria group bacterium]|nr:hypothetical protein [Patescibacteria group bacterium]